MKKWQQTLFYLLVCLQRYEGNSQDITKEYVVYVQRLRGNSWYDEECKEMEEKGNEVKM